MAEIAFTKYDHRGAYHWPEYFGPVHRLNAQTRARYNSVIAALKAHGAPRGGRLLDVGCGDGALAALLARSGFHVCGVDTTPSGIDCARQEFSRRRLTGDFRVVEGYRYPYGDDTFAGVVCCEVIEHVREPQTLLLEMWRVLAPGGLLVVTTPARFTERPIDTMHVQEWFPEEFRRFCAGTLGTPVELALTHPVALFELYTTSRAAIRRPFRLAINALSKCGVDVFGMALGLHTFACQIASIRKPAAPPHNA